ncbi:Tumor necrosis factor receptor superfamily member 17 [Chelonia mydas]|uniref:Tumor necrosis factor receptor superfamily member 17 n=1 Tax=Chelonia mydas TaxID=8469 RepID=M7BZ46_CHEMY|nr:Tumor necrosis factor receptor superfamily member 17 [Chelonia mydas]
MDRFLKQGARNGNSGDSENESAMELNVILKADIETSVNADIIGDSLQSEASLTYSEEECPCGDCGLVKLQTGFDTSFPLPATEEGATVLVTTKTSEYCSYIPDAIMTL